MRVYCIRHGESVLNAEHRHQFSDTPLSELGQQQALVLAQRVSTLPIEAFLCSPFERTRQTAAALLQTKAVPITYHEEIGEVRQPSVFRGEEVDAPHIVEIKKQLKDHYHDADWHYSDEENFYDLRARGWQALELIGEQTYSHVGVVSHGAILQMIIALMVFGPKMSSKVFWRWRRHTRLDNTSVTLCERRGKRWQLISWNDHSHL